MGDFKKPSEERKKPSAEVRPSKEINSPGEVNYVDSRASNIQLIQLQAAAIENSSTSTLTQLQAKASSFAGVSRVAQLKALSDARSSSTQPDIVQLQNNKTGLPEELKSGMESISGMSLGDVKVHRNSDKPAQLQAHAYAQGTDIHLGPGQEKHLPHELGHVVQQKQGRVKPTVQLKGKVNINDDPALEKEADMLGNKAQARDQSKSLEKKVKKHGSTNKMIQGVFQSNSNVYQFGGGEGGGSSWIPAALALGTSLFLVYRSWGKNKTEISAEEAQERDFVSAGDVERDAKSLNAIPSTESNSGPIDTTGSSDNSSNNDLNASFIRPSSNGKSADKKSKKLSFETGEGPEFLKPVKAVSSLQQGGNFDDMRQIAAADTTVESGKGNEIYSSTSIGSNGYTREKITGPQVKKDDNSVEANVLQADHQIRTQFSSTHTQVKLGDMSLKHDDSSIDMKAGLGGASLNYSGQQTHAKASAQGPNTGLHIGSDSINVHGSAGNASAEVAASLRGKRWGFTAGAKAEAEGPSFKVGTDGMEMNGVKTSATAGFSTSRLRDENDPDSAEQVFWLSKEKGELPKAGINLEAVGHIIEDNPELIQKFDEALKITMADELGIPPADLSSMETVSDGDFKSASIFDKIASFFKSDSSSSSSSDESSSDDDRSSSSSWDDDSVTVSEEIKKDEESQDGNVTESNVEEKSEEDEEIERAIDNLHDYFLDNY